MILNIRPAEIVHPSQMLKSSSHSYQSSHSFVDGARRHMVGVNARVGWVYCLSDSQSLQRIKTGSENHGVVGYISLTPHQVFNHACSLYLVVILSSYPLFGADIRPA